MKEANMPTRSLRDRSAELRSRAERCIPGGVSSNVRLSAPRVFFARGQGAWLWDVDGNDYVDYVLGQGPALLGHAAEPVQAAVAEACRRGNVYGAQHGLEVEAAELLCRVAGWPEMVRFGCSGTESVQAALRLARALTGRTKFVRFEGHYHGWLDNVLITADDGPPRPASAGQLAAHLHDSYALPWNDPEPVADLLARRGEEVAAILTEPMMLNSGAVPPREGYLQRLRELCDQHGVLLIFDEVITGFRLALGGAVERFGVVPDLAVYAKALAGGWPVSALAGRAELMEGFGTGAVNHSGTFNASVMASAATVASLATLAADPPYERMTAFGERLMTTIRELGARHGLPLRVQGVPMAFHVSFGDPTPVWDHRAVVALDGERYAALARLLAEHGLWVASRGIWYVSTAHGDAELGATVARLDAALAALSR
jgi:glutamate-1-semialdehyde 2,1-aminomutase